MKIPMSPWKGGLRLKGRISIDDVFRRNFFSRSSLTVGTIMVVAVAMRNMVSPLPTGLLLGGLSGGAFILSLSFFIRRNFHIKLCGYLFIACLEVLCILAGLYNGGLRAPLTVTFTLLPLIGFLADGKLGARIALVSSIFSILTLVIVEQMGLNRELIDPQNYSLYGSLVLTAVTLVSYSLASAYAHSRKITEKHLLAEKQNTKNILEATPACVKIISREGKVLSMNEIGLKLIEADKGLEQVLGANISDMLLPAYRKPFSEMNQRICNGEKHESMAFEAITLKGSKRWMETHSAPITMEDGTVASLSITHDVTERKLSQIRKEIYLKTMTLIADKTPLRTILNSIVQEVENLNPKLICSILLLDHSGEHLHSGADSKLPEFYITAIDGLSPGYNQGSCGTAVYLRRRVIVENVQTDPLWAQYRELAAQAQIGACWSEPILAGNEVLGTFAIYSKEPSTPSPEELKMIDASAKLAAVAIQHQQAEEAITQQRNQLLSTSKMAALGEMAGGVAHEINNPLAVIIGKSSQLRKQLATGLPMGERLMTDIEKIENTAQRIAKIVSGLRSFSRNADNDPMTKLNIRQVVEDAITLASDKFAHQSIELRKIFNIPAEAFVLGRQAQLEQVLLNLLHNAHDAILEKTNKWVEVRVSQSQDKFSIAVTDCGTGIPDEVVEKMMQPFFTTKEVGKGTGLGLSISKGIIEGHGGEFTYDKTCQNTRFNITIPVAHSQPRSSSERIAG